MFSSNTSQVSNDAVYVEDVFSTYLYTGNGSSLTVTNNIDLSTKGGLVWCKDRTIAGDNALYDTARGVQRELSSNNTTSSGLNTGGVTAFNTTGFTVGADGNVNANGYPIVSWTFRKQPKFFDVVTYTGDGGVNGDSNSTRSISHSLGSQPGMVIIKRTDSTSNWYGVHRNDGTNNAVWASVNLSNACTAGLSQAGYNAYITSTTFNPFYIRDSLNQTPLPNVTGATYVAYLFAHNAGGFGLTGTDNVISCGSFTCNGSGIASINLGYEPQWLLVKTSAVSDNWYLYDNMRGMTAGTNTSSDIWLAPNLSQAEATSGMIGVTATGFDFQDPTLSARAYIYIAIRRGPMKVPTSGTSVFKPGRGTDATSTFITTGFPSDLSIQRWMGGADNNVFSDRLRGFSPANTTVSPYLISNLTDAEVNSTGTNYAYTNTGFQVGGNNGGNWWALNFRRAPSFFDEVCYTGTGAVLNVNHNLGVAPEFMIVKNRTSSGTRWAVYYGDNTSYMYLDMTQYPGGLGPSSGFWNNTSPTSSVFTVGVGAGFVVNNAGDRYVAYLFASCAGVSKVGSYTGTGATQTISCGFTGGARFVLVKRTDSTGDWYVWDTARGMVSGTDPSLLLNSTAAEVNANSVYTTTGGFQIVSTAAGINASGGSYIFLAVA